jgi:hypothetical protein
MLWTEFIWFGTGTNGGLSWTRWRTFGFHKKEGNLLNSWVTIKKDPAPCS